MSDVKKDKFIEINYNHEYRLYIDDNIYDSSKFFYPVYQKSVELINEIHSYSAIREEICKYDNTCPYPKKENTELNINNLIMYCANRGGGKSSAMLSFGSALKNIGERSEKEKNGYAEFWGGMSGCRFSVLDAIDPTSLCEKEAIMTIILSRLFLEMRQDMKRREANENLVSTSGNINDHSRYEIIKKFRECYKYINVINGKQNEFNDEDGDFGLEELASLGDSSRFKNEFHNLVKLFLQNKYKTEDIKCCYLVIQIDDADLNTRMSYDILEDLRKYCMVPNVIILMAVNMHQMHQVVEQHFVKEYEPLLSVSSGNSEFISKDDVRDMAVRYIDKVMPAAHQIYLPQIDDFLRNGSSRIAIRYKKPAEKNGRESCDALSYADKGTKDTVTGFQERLIRLIYMKTGITMVKPDSYTHRFMPQNMRELTHFLSFMCSLPDLEPGLNYAEMFFLMMPHDRAQSIGRFTKSDAEKELIKRQNNLDAFTRFLLNNWCDINLIKEDQKDITRLSEATADTIISVARSIIDKYTSDTNESTDGIPALADGSFSKIMSDIDAIPDFKKRECSAVQTYKFIYALHLYFTIFLHREMLLSIESHSFSRFRRVTGCELWSPDYSSFTDYPMLGRFVVNYPVYLKLNNTNKDMVIWRSLEDNFYMNVAGETFFADGFNNTKVSKNLSKLAEGKKCNADIIFDLAFAMQSKAMLESSYSTKKVKELNELNSILLVLLNWDVSNYIEKNMQDALDRTFFLRFFEKETDWYHKFYSALSDEISLISIGSKKTNCSFDDLVPADVVFYANPDTQGYFVTSIISAIKDVINGSSLLEDSIVNDNAKVQPDNVIDICTSIIPKVQIICSDHLDIISQFSNTAKNISESLNSLNTAYEGLSSLISEKTKSSNGQEFNNFLLPINRSEKIDSYITNNYSKLRDAYNSWYKVVTDPGLESSIIKEIKESFDKGW